MCGRLDINQFICQVVSDTLGISFVAAGDNNTCPSDTVSTNIKPLGGFQ